MQEVSNLITLPEIVALAASFIACITSLKNMKIPNWLTFPAAFVALAVNGLNNNFLNAIGGWFLLVFVAYFPFRFSMGAVKLLAAIGAALGPLNGFINFCVFYVIHLLFALMSLKGAETEEQKEKLKAQLVPLGPMIFIATLLTICIRKVNWSALQS